MGDNENADNRFSALSGLFGEDGGGESQSRATKASILERILTGDLAGAESRAGKWTDDEPDDAMSWIMLADVQRLRDDLAGALATLQSASEVDPGHPMLLRGIALSALKAKAFTAAHGAVFAARLRDLPELIVADLRGQLDEKATFTLDSGGFSEAENRDPAWRALLPSLWQVRSDPVRLAWAEHEGQCFVFNEEIVEFAAACARVAAERALREEDASLWERYPEAAVVAARSLGFSPADEIPSPEMLGPLQGIYVPAALHIAGHYLEFLSSSTLEVTTPHGKAKVGSGLGQYSCALSSRSLADYLTRLFDRVLEGRISLRGPNEKLASALPWLIDGSRSLV